MRRGPEIDPFYGWPTWPDDFMGRHGRWVIPFTSCLISMIVLYVASVIFSYASSRTVAGDLVTFGVVLGTIAAIIVLAVRAVRGGYSSWRSFRRSRGALTKDEKSIASQREAMSVSWGRAQKIRAQLRSGSFSGGRIPWGLAPAGGESLVAEGGCAYSRYYGRDVSWVQGSNWSFGSAGFVLGASVATAVGNSSRRRAAEREAAAQWREQQNAQMVVTTHRIAVLRADGVWLSFWYGGASAIYPGIAEWTLVLDFDDTEPLMLSGLPVPAAAVTAIAALHGLDGLLHHPGLAPLDS